MFGKTKSKRFIRIMVHEEEFLTDIDTNECVGSRYCTFSLPIEIKTDLTNVPEFKKELMEFLKKYPHEEDDKETNK